MIKRSINIELPEELWNIITNFKIDGESDSEIISKIVKEHLAHGYDQDIENLIDANRLKYLIEIQHDMLMSFKDLLEKKGLINPQEWAQIMQERLTKNSRSFT